MTRPTVVVTASAGSFSDLPALLSDIPVQVENRPLIRFDIPESWAPLDAALTRLGGFAAIAFTSPRAAQAVAERWSARGPGLESQERPVVWATGKATADGLAGVLGPVRIPEPSSGSPAAALAEAMLEAGCHGRVLFPCGESRREELPEILRAAGCVVDEVICYRSVLADAGEAAAVAAEASVLVVASPSVMHLLAASCPPSRRPQLVAIGPTTAATARALDWPPAATAEQPSSRGAASAIASLLVNARR